jgi:xylulokinase
VLLDESGRVLGPAIIWCDQRTEQECRWLDREVGPARLLELTANPALTNFTLTKLLWVRTHEPAIWSRVRHVLLPKDHVRYRLSGEFAIDVADASGTLMLDVVRRRWSQEIMDAVNIDTAVLPALFESSEVCARVSDQGAAATGLPVGTPIVAGAGDQAAGAVGMGITRPGTVSATLGTSGVVFAATDRPFLDPGGRLHTFCHAIPDRWHVMGVTQAAGLSLRWLRDQFGLAAGGDQAYQDMVKEASAVAPGAEGVLWAPYLMGERTPHLDPNVRAAPSSKAWRSACAIPSRFFRSWGCLSRRCGSVEAVRDPRSGARYRPTCTAGTWKPSRRKKGPAMAQRSLPVSGPGTGNPWTKRAMPSSTPRR